MTMLSRLSVEDALRSLHSTSGGLSSTEVQRRRLEFGANDVVHVRGEPLALRLGKQFTHFFAIILWVAAALAFLAQARQPGTGMGTLGGAIIGVIVINALFAFWQEYRAERAILALRQLLPRFVKTMRDGTLVSVPASDIVPGDVIALQEGDDVPADCRLIAATGLRVNTATITGESYPHAKDARPSAIDDLLTSKNTVLAGTSVVSGDGTALVFATGMRTEFGKIAHLTQLAPATRSPLQREIAAFSRVVGGLAVALGAACFALGGAARLPFWEQLMFAVGIIVANVPEGLLPTVTLALAMAAQRMAKRHVLIRHLPSVETLGCTTVICTDKTGTLTHNRMSVRRIFSSGQVLCPDDPLSHATLCQNHRSLLEGALLCQTLKVTEHDGQQEWLGDPMEVALVTMAGRVMPELHVRARVDELPFDTDRKRLGTLHPLADGEAGFVLHVKGAPETVLPLCSRVEYHGKLQLLDAEGREAFRHAQETMAQEGLRVLAFAYRPVAPDDARDELEVDLILSGLIGLDDPPRPDVASAMQRCAQAGIKVIMITGDHPHTAHAVARQVGLVRTENVRVIIGEELRKLSDTQLQLALDAPELIFARVGADQKLQIVRALMRKGHIVAVTGDGVNDAPALRQAHIGIAMGRSGTDVAREASDMILLDDHFASIVNGIEEGRAVFANIRKFLTYILTSNVPEIVPYIAFVLTRLPLPLTIIQILAVDLGTDLVPALGLGAEPPEPEIMRQPPRSTRERLWNWPLLARAYLFLGMLEALAAMAAYLFVLWGGGWSYGQELGRRDALYLQGTTACLAAIIVMQVVNVFLCRSDRRSTFSFGPVSNRLLLWGVGAELALILAIVYTPWGHMLFGTAPIGTAAWLFVIPFALGMLGFEEARKRLVRARA